MIVHVVSDRICLPSIQHTANVCTIVCSVQALEGMATDSEDGESVSVTAEKLQPAERHDIQLL